jgi:beta-lactamase superfamily II metal-dependent hydrolase
LTCDTGHLNTIRHKQTHTTIEPYFEGEKEVADYFEIDFLDVESKKSGDAIPLRYEIGGRTHIHVVDAGYQSTGDSVVRHINKHYGNPSFIDHVVATHHDGDHAGGLRTILETYDVGALWMLRPWLYAGEIIDRFRRYNNAENLARNLRNAFPNFAALEDIANAKAIPILEPFQGATIGAFTVLAPSRQRFLDLVVESERTPDIFEEISRATDAGLGIFGEIMVRALQLVNADWGVEKFSSEATSTENCMSVVQYAKLSGKTILLTADVDVEGLDEAAAYAPFVGLHLPGIDRFQVPHHGSRRNVSTASLNKWLGPILPSQLPEGSERWTAIISSAKEDVHHPRKAVQRAIIHRGGSIAQTEGQAICTSMNAPDRGWVAVRRVPYPTEQED